MFSKSCKSLVSQNILGVVLFTILAIPTSMTMVENPEEIFCAECSGVLHEREELWYKPPPPSAPDAWKHFSATASVDTDRMKCFSGFYGSRRFAWCAMEKEDEDGKVNVEEEQEPCDHCAGSEDKTTTAPLTTDGKTCFSRCQKRDGNDQLTCRAENGAFEPCTNSIIIPKDSGSPVEYTYYGDEVCQNACKMREGFTEKMCQTRSKDYVRCKPARKKLNEY